jgi:ABC-2 type transport system ATP-binding protein
MLRLTDLRKSYGQLTAVDGLSLEIRPGEVFGLLGPNGAGKSTTIALSVGILHPDAGSVMVGAVGAGAGAAGSPTEPRVRARIGLAPQSIALYDNLTARENLMFFASLYGGATVARAARCEELLGLVGLSDRAASRVGTFSGGMKRRLNLAAALVNDPSLVLLDEPTAGVDPQSRNALFDMVLDLKRQGRTVVYTTHYMEEAQRLCDRVGIVERGRLIAVGTVDELIASHGGDSAVHVQRAEGESVVRTADPLAELQRALSSPGVLGVRIERPNLESVFLHLTGRSLRD